MGKKYPLLICDSSLYVVTILRKKLAAEGFDVYAAVTAEDVLQFAAEVKPMLILMELILPGTDGFSLIQTLTRDPRTKKIPIVVHSSVTAKDNVMRAIQCGAANYIVKPASFATILHRIVEELAKQKCKLPAISKPEGDDIQGRSFIEDEAIAELPVEEKLQLMREQCERLVAMPQAVSKALECANDEDSGAEELAFVIESDTAITATVLRKANTVVYGRSEPILDVRDAIVRIGFRQTVDLVSCMAVVKQFSQDEKALGFNRMAFWEQSLATGLLASEIAKYSNLCDPNEAFVAGLMHHLGMVLMDESIPADFERCIEHAYNTYKDIEDVEKELLGFQHHDLSQLVLEDWHFPEYLRMILHEATQTQNYVLPAQSDWEQVGRVVQVASILAKAFGFGLTNWQLLDSISPAMAEYACLIQQFDTHFRSKIATEVEAFKMFLSIPTLERSPGMSSSIGFNRVLYYDVHQTKINSIQIFFEQRGYVVEPMASIAELIQTVRERPAGILSMIEATGAGDVQQIQDELLDLDASVPVIFVADPLRQNQWKQGNTRRLTEVLPMPLSGSDLLRKISNLSAE